MSAGRSVAFTVGQRVMLRFAAAGIEQPPTARVWSSKSRALFIEAATWHRRLACSGGEVDLAEFQAFARAVAAARAVCIRQASCVWPALDWPGSPRPVDLTTPMRWGLAHWLSILPRRADLSERDRLALAALSTRALNAFDQALAAAQGGGPPACVQAPADRAVAKLLQALKRIPEPCRDLDGLAPGWPAGRSDWHLAIGQIHVVA